MNSDQAKKLHLPDLMSRLGYQAVSITKNGGEYWYLSPFRGEAKPSFHISFLNGKWIWNDFGDSGGTVIDFIMRHENLNRVGDALAFLDSMYIGDFKALKGPELLKPPKCITEKKTLVLECVGLLKNDSLISSLKCGRINL